jgi:hypothetical protein
MKCPISPWRTRMHLKHKRRLKAEAAYLRATIRKSHE